MTNEEQQPRGERLSGEVLDKHIQACVRSELQTTGSDEDAAASDKEPLPRGGYVLAEELDERIRAVIEQEFQPMTADDIAAILDFDSVPDERFLPTPKADQPEEPDDTPWGNKVRLALVLALMERDGMHLSAYGNKAKAAQLANIVTGLPLQVCKNYFTMPRLPLQTHWDEILKLDTMLSELGMSIRLSENGKRRK